ncbi:leucine-rich repeat protein [Ruminococcus sp.]|uniref:leucine-rich repeat protein n=1 Tax=Ruminococcus sp. TaxID=41978 RepID=UPI0025EC9BFF|nr:leucine-rich repeat protein [Ruminococcus sp.]
MKLFKHLTSATLALTVAAGAAAASIPAKADAADGQIIYDTVLNEWQQRIDAEMVKFPHLSYWNYKQTGVISEDTYSEYTPDKRYRSYLTEEKVKGLNYDSKFFCRKAYYTDWTKTTEPEVDNGECVGFARKLSNDIWGPVVLIRHKVKKNTYGANSNQDPMAEDYIPQIGDIVRLDYKVSTSKGDKTPGHSIFITDIDSNGKITFAECNGEMNDCQIRWGRDRYYHALNWKAVDLPDQNGNPVNMIMFTGNTNSQATVTREFFLDHATYFERPGIAGDLNFDGQFTGEDAEIFESTVMYNGYTSNSDQAPLAFYDVNGDGYVNDADINAIRYGNPERRLVKLSEIYSDVKCKWNRINNVSGFRFTDGCYYVKNNIGGVSWIGTVDSELTSVSVPSRVYSSNDNCWYTVNEIGYYSQFNNSGNRYPTCTENCGIKTLTIPDTVKRIHEYAFSKGALTTLKFAGNNSQLEEIDQCAFSNCKSLRTLDLRPAKNLKVIGAFAFDGCSNLNYIDLPYTKQNLSLGTFMNSATSQSIFGSNLTKTITLYINDEDRTLTSSSTIQPLIFGRSDYDYMKNNKVRVYGKMFRAKCRGNNNNFIDIGQRGITNGFLYVN